MSVDSLAAVGDQDRFSPYAAMGDEPAGLVDPNGTYWMPPRTSMDNQVFTLGWKAFLNYILFNEDMQVVGSFTGSFQATGDGAWTEIGMQEPLPIPENGYLAVYLSNATAIDCDCGGGVSDQGDVYFDQMQVSFTRGNLKEETHYYPFGLPMGDIGSAAVGFTPNRRKYQGNEYIKDAGLNLDGL